MFNSDSYNFPPSDNRRPIFLWKLPVFSYFLPILVVLGWFTPIGWLMLLVLRTQLKKKTVRSPAEEADKIDEASAMETVSPADWPEHFHVVHDLTALKFDPTLQRSHQRQGWMRSYNLQQNDPTAVAAVILAEVLVNDTGESRDWQGVNGEEPELAILLNPYRVILYQPGRWIHEDKLIESQAFDKLEERATTAVTAFTQATGIPIKCLVPYLTSRTSGAEKVTFELGLNLLTGDRLGVEPDEAQAGNVRLELGWWTFALARSPGQAQGRTMETDLDACQELQKEIITALTEYIETAGEMVETFETYPIPVDNGSNDAGVTYTYEGMEVWIGGSLDEAPIMPLEAKAAAGLPLTQMPVALDTTVLPILSPVSEQLPPVIALPELPILVPKAPFQSKDDTE